MKKSLVVVGAVASAVVLSTAPLVVPALGMGAFAAEGETGATYTGPDATVQDKVTETLNALVDRLPDYERWDRLTSLMYILEDRYAVGGKGAAGEEIFKSGEDIIADALKAANVDTKGMNSMDRTVAAKSLGKYNEDEKFKTLVDGILSDAEGIIFGYEGMEDSYTIVGNLPEGYDVESLKKMENPAQVVAAIQKVPGYEVRANLCRAILALVEAEYASGATVDSLKPQLDAVEKAAVAVEEYEAAANKTDAEEVKTTTNELKQLVEKTKANPEYQKYEKLVRGVHNAEVLLDSLKTPVVVTPNTQSNTNTQSAATGAAAVITLAVDESEALDAETVAEIVATIKALGDAMRTVGVQTTLGEGLTTATVDDLSKAIETARGTQKFDQYEELVEAIDYAEVLIEQGIDDPAALKEVLATVQEIAKKVLPPDAGVAPTDNTELSATASFSTPAIIAAISAVAGVAVVLKRRFSNKAE